MKQHIKKIQFLVIALFTIMLSSCSDDLYHQGSKPVAKNKTVSIEEFKRNTGLHNFSKTFKIPKDNTIAYRNADGSYELSDFDINFDYIKQVVVENKISYTFNIVPKILTSKSIFNLVVYNHDGNWETSIIELIPTDENFDKLLAGIDNKFEGNIKQVYSARIPGNCYTVAYYVENCTYGDSDACRITCDQCNLCMTLIRYNVCNGTEIMQPLYPISGGGGGVGSGLSDPSGYIFDPNMYELGSKKYQQAKNAAEFWHDLTDEQEQWVYESEQNKETYRVIIAYINRPENIDNTEVRNFGREIIEQMRSNPNTFTSIKPFLIEKQIDDSQLDPCAKGVFQQIENTTNNDFAEVLAKLGADGSVYNTTMISAVAPSGNPAQTIRTSAYNYKIYISTDYEDKTKLFIASLQLHELVHAYFLSLIDDCLIQNNCQLLVTFPELWEYYVSVCDNQYPSNSSSHHEQIANSYVTAISAALQEYQPGLPQQVYDDLAWNGLEGTTVFNALHPAGSPSRQGILNRKAAEQSGHPIAEGTPQEQINYGQPCN